MAKRFMSNFTPTFKRRHSFTSITSRTQIASTKTLEWKLAQLTESVAKLSDAVADTRNDINTILADHRYFSEIHCLESKGNQMNTSNFKLV